MPLPQGPIGVFDSGFGGLTVLRELRAALPQADFLYLGDNARAPYGTRSFELVYEFTLQAVRRLFDSGCPLVILACNTASAKALRSIQQRDLPVLAPERRVLGVIRPTVEALAGRTRTGCVGVFGTPGTVASHSYRMELAKLAPDIRVFEHACPMCVPLVENREGDGDGADYFIRKDIDALMAECPDIDAVVLACTLSPAHRKNPPPYARGSGHHPPGAYGGGFAGRLPAPPPGHRRRHHPRRHHPLPHHRATRPLRLPRQPVYGRRGTIGEDRALK